MGALALMEPTLKYHPCFGEVLTWTLEAGLGTLSGGKFDWGGRLPKCNGGARRFAQAVWKSALECKGISELNCETYKSSRCESRA